MAGLQLVADRINVSMDVPGDAQSFNFTQTSAKYQINNAFAPVNGGANNLIINETKNSYNGGFRWKHTTVYNASPTASPGTLKLFRFVNGGSETETEIFSVDGSGNFIFDNNVTVTGTFTPGVLAIPATIDVSGTTQTFQYSGNHTSKFVLKNLFAAAGGSPSYVNLDFTNSTTGGYRFIHTSQSTDTAGLGGFKLQIYNNVGTTLDVFDITIDGGGVPVLDLYGALNVHGSTAFNIGAVGTCIFYVSPLIPEPATGGSAATRNYVDSVAGRLDNPLSLADTLTFNWSYAAPTNPATYQFINTFTDGQQDKKYRHRVLTSDIFAGREWSIDYTLIGTSDLNGIFEIKHGASPLPVDVPFRIDVFPFAANSITLDGNLYLGSHFIKDVTDPLFAQDAATKNYVDNSISAHTITLTGAVTGSGTASIATTLSNIITVSGATQAFIIAGNSTATYSIKNSLAATGGTPSYLRLDLLNSTTGGWRFLHTSSTTDTAGLGTLKIQALNSASVTGDALTLSVNSGTGIPDVAFNGSGTFAGQVTFNGSSVAAVINLATYNFNLNNTNASGVTQYIISNTIPVLAFGYNNTTALSYIDSIGQPFQIRISGTTYIHVSTSGYLGMGTITPTQAKLVISGGVANVASEDTCIRVTGSSNSTKIELGNTSASGKLFELGSNNAGSFVITDRTGTTARLTINTSGNTILSGNLAIGGASANAPLQFTNSTVNRKIVLYEGSNNDHQFYGFGVNGGTLRFQLDQTTSNFVFYAATSSSASNEVFRVYGTGDVLAAGSYFGRRPSISVYMNGNATGTTLTTSGTYYKVAGTTSNINANNFSSPSDNRCTYTGTTSIIAQIDVCLSATLSGAIADEIQFAIHKNGTVVSNSIVSRTIMPTTIAYESCALGCLVSMATNDYVEVWATDLTTSSKTLTVKNLVFNVSAT